MSEITTQTEPPTIQTEEFQSSPTISALSAALSAAQGEMGGAKKGSFNPHYKQKYADLSEVWGACREPLSKNGLAVIQLPSATGPTVCVTTVLTHSSGEWISCRLEMTSEKNTPQGIGTAITYARRYSLAAIAGVSQEDDDGNLASGRSGQEEEDKDSPTLVVAAFRKFGVTIEMLEKRLGYSLAKMTDEDRTDLGIVYKRINSGEKKPEEFFGAMPPTPQPNPVPQVDHTPAEGKDEPRPGEKKRTRKKQEDPPSAELSKVDPIPARTEPPQPGEQTSLDDRPATEEEKAEIRPKLNAFIAKAGSEPVRSFIFKQTKTKDLRDVLKPQWDAVLAELAKADAEGEEALKKLVSN